VHIVSAVGSSHRARRADAAAGTERVLGGLRAMARAARVKVAVHPVASDPADAITQVAADERADLIVVGSKASRGTRQLSSVPKAVMDRASCAVMVV
jgi:nucleotide-binding universal stress UspA family protein